jgi:hypothetical protein
VKEGRKEGSGGMEKLIVENFDKFYMRRGGEGLVIRQSGNIGRHQATSGQGFIRKVLNLKKR